MLYQLSYEATHWEPHITAMIILHFDNDNNNNNNNNNGNDNDNNDNNNDNNFIKIFLKKPVYKSSHILLSSTKILLQIKIITRTFEYLYNCYNQSFKF